MESEFHSVVISKIMFDFTKMFLYFTAKSVNVNNTILLSSNLTKHKNNLRVYFSFVNYTIYLKV